MEYHNEKLPDYFKLSTDTLLVDISNSNFERIKNFIVENEVEKLSPKNMSIGYFIRYEWRGTSGIGLKTIESDILTDAEFKSKFGKNSISKIIEKFRIIVFQNSKDIYGGGEFTISPKVAIIKTDDDWFYFIDTESKLGRWRCDDIDGVIELLKSFKNQKKIQSIRKEIFSQIKELDDNKILKLSEFIKTL